MTFCVTWVVVNMVVTHFKKPMVGRASGASGLTLPFNVLDSSALFKVAADSNQKRHVISAANSAKLALLSFIEEGICR